ncbi:hypothetical protein H5J22_08560 [Cetobacterium sp. 8H]|uniref:hypothetical protein n=1 Tax=Cetobacterium sp. 8H TaxID=2759681 RepID=UPI00163B87B9|nr:hypothetical protein [Cetobacterium sp. 8H]MBC2851442.1 hypothetical protein [Cetobacterium sp. 8H]
MNKIRLLFNERNIYIVLLLYFFSGYFYPSFLQKNNIYSYITEYFGIYENLLWIFFIGYGFSMFMKNPTKKIVLKVRLYFMIISGISVGYLYLIDSLKNFEETSLDKIQEYIIQIGILNINLGYLEIYTFLKIYFNVKKDVFIGVLIAIIFISTIIITGKAIKGLLLLVINYFKSIYFGFKERKRIKEEKLRIEKQEKLEKEIYDEICNIQKMYQEKEEQNQEQIDKEEENVEKDDEKNDIGIEISEEKRDIESTWFPTGN